MTKSCTAETLTLSPVYVRLWILVPGEGLYESSGTRLDLLVWETEFLSLESEGLELSRPVWEYKMKSRDVVIITIIIFNNENKMLFFVPSCVQVQKKISSCELVVSMNRLKKKLNTHPDPNCIRQEIKTLNKEIKSYFHKLKSKNVRKGIVPGNSKSLWDALKKAKDLNVKNLPDILFKNKIQLSEQDHAAAFANFFSTKVNTIVNETQIEPGVYNGVNKLNVDNEFFMTKADITECIKSIKTKTQ